MNAGAATARSASAEIISTVSGLLPLRREWTELALGQPNSTFFQLPIWFFNWWAHFGSGELRTWIIRDESKVKAVVPCFLHRWEGRRQLTLAGTGISDYLEPLVAPERRKLLADLLARDLDRFEDWDIAVCQDLDNPSFLTQINPGAHFTIGIEQDTSCCEIPINTSFDQHWAARPHGLRRNVRRYLKKALEIDTPRFAVTCEPDEKALNDLFRLHAERWTKQGQAGMVVANRSAAFLMDVVPAFAAEGLIRLFTLHFQNRIVAAILAFAYNGALFAYLSGFDPEFEIFGFGRLLLLEAIRYAFENGYSKWSFLRGIEAYKFDWGGREIPKQRVIIHRRP